MPTGENKQIFLEMARTGTKMGVAKSRIEKEAAREQAELRSMPGYRVQAKISTILQKRAIAKPLLVHSAYITPFSSSDVQALQQPPAILQTKAPAPRAETSQFTELFNKVTKHLETKGVNEITKHAILEYLRTNPDRALAYASQVRREKMEAYRQLKEKHHKKHKHIFPEDLVVLMGSENSHTATFPKHELRLSTASVTKSSSGAEGVETSPSSDSSTLMLEPIARIHTPVSTPLGSFLKIPDGTDFSELDHQGVASLTINRCAALHKLIQQFDKSFGVLELFQQHDSFIFERSRSATPPPSILPRVDAGRSVSSMARSNPPPPKPAPFPLLTEEEIELLQCEDDDVKIQANTELIGELTATTGQFAGVIRDVDSYSGSSDDSGFEPMCLVCRSRQAVQPCPVFETMHPYESTDFAKNSLERWRAGRKYSQLVHQKFLSKKLGERVENRKRVACSIAQLANVTHEANGEAERWKNARDFRGRLANGGAGVTIWHQPSKDIREEEHRLGQIRLFWARLQQFLRMIRQPASDELVGYIELLRNLLLNLRALSGSLFLRWLHSTGPRVLVSRDGLRLAMYVRIELHVSLTSIQKWCKLPAQRAEGWRLSTEM